MRILIDQHTQTIGTVAVELRDLAAKLNPSAAVPILEAVELLDRADEILTALYINTATKRHRVIASQTVPPPCTCGPPGVTSPPATIAPLPTDGQGMLWTPDVWGDRY